MPFQNRVTVVTGGAGGIGKTIVKEFNKNGTAVCIIDKNPNDYLAGFITGENIFIDGGMTKQMIYHNNFGWTLNTGKGV